jgi:hypothetical protein
MLVNAEMLFEGGREFVEPLKGDGPKTKKPVKARSHQNIVLLHQLNGGIYSFCVYC